MGVRVLYDGEIGAMYCSTSDWAFGPVFSEENGHDAQERIECFLRWLGKANDPRSLTDHQLSRKYSEWRAQEEEQWKEEEKLIEELGEEDNELPPTNFQTLEEFAKNWEFKK
jgi:hypothetical protein